MFTVLPLQYAAEGHYNFNLGQTAVTLIPRFNYLCSVWVLDIIDAANNPILSGLVMVPNIDILKPHLSAKQLLGALVPYETEIGAYSNPENMGTKFTLLWYPPGTEVVLP